MRVDVFSIFPEYLQPLNLSLIGKARSKGILDLAVHDLREYTHDRHRTVDDTPYGGGAGMVMRPEPWGEALDELVGDGTQTPHLLVPTPSGRPLTQGWARELADEPWLAVACGRYEGIDERVMEHARSRMKVTPFSLGDYVLNGGEVAAMALIEAVGRLLPGVVGNAASLVEESHEDGLLEYPVYTKPASWRGLDVPDVLLSGNHAAIDAWRHERAKERTAQRRPDLMAASSLPVDDVALHPAVLADVPELVTLQRAAWASTSGAPALTEGLDDVRAAVSQGRIAVLRKEGRLLGAVRTGLPAVEGAWRAERVDVVPDAEPGLMARLVVAAAEAAGQAARYEVVVGVGTEQDPGLRKAGLRPARDGAESVGEGEILLSSPRRPAL